MTFSLTYEKIYINDQLQGIIPQTGLIYDNNILPNVWYIFDNTNILSNIGISHNYNTLITPLDNLEIIRNSSNISGKVKNNDLYLNNFIVNDIILTKEFTISLWEKHTTNQIILDISNTSNINPLLHLEIINDNKLQIIIGTTSNLLNDINNNWNHIYCTLSKDNLFNLSINNISLYTIDVSFHTSNIYNIHFENIHNTSYKITGSDINNILDGSNINISIFEEDKINFSTDLNFNIQSNNNLENASWTDLFTITTNGDIWSVPIVNNNEIFRYYYSDTMKGYITIFKDQYYISNSVTNTFKLGKNIEYNDLRIFNYVYEENSGLVASNIFFNVNDIYFRYIGNESISLENTHHGIYMINKTYNTLSESISDNLTICYWVKVSNRDIIFDSIHLNSENENNLIIKEIDNKIVCIFKNSESIEYIITCNKKLINNVWTFIAISISNKQFKLYVDNFPMTGITFENSLDITNIHLKGTDSLYIQDFRIYQKYLIIEEIIDIYTIYDQSFKLINYTPTIGDNNSFIPHFNLKFQDSILYSKYPLYKYPTYKDEHQSLISWYKFEENPLEEILIVDSITNCNLFIINNSNILTRKIGIHAPFSYIWNGNIKTNIDNSYIYGNTDVFSNLSNFSISFWKKLENLNIIDETFIIKDKIYISLCDSSNSVTFKLNNSYILNIPYISDNNWHFWCFTHDNASLNSIIYKDGININFLNSPDLILSFTNNESIYIGGSNINDISPSGVQGISYLEDLRIYNKALNYTEIYDIMNSFPGYLGQLNDILYWYRFDDNPINTTILPNYGYNLLIYDATIHNANAYVGSNYSSINLGIETISSLMICWYKFDSAIFLLDSSGNDNILTNNLNVQSNIINYIRGDSSSIFTIDNYLNITNDGSFSPTSNFSICIWVKTDNIENSIKTIVSCTDLNSGWAININNKNLELNSYSSESKTYIDNIDICNNEWNHITVIFNVNSNIMTNYINGILKSSILIEYSNCITDKLFIGYTNFTGYIDDFRIYKLLLSEKEINTIIGYNLTRKIENSGSTSSIYSYNWSGLTGGNTSNNAYISTDIINLTNNFTITFGCTKNTHFDILSSIFSIYNDNTLIIDISFSSNLFCQYYSITSNIYDYIDNTYHHFGFVFSDSNIVIYKDGISRHLFTFNTNIDTTLANFLYIGGKPLQNTDISSYSLQDFRIFNKSLTNFEILETINTIKGDTDNLSLWYKNIIEDGTIYDFSDTKLDIETISSDKDLILNTNTYSTLFNHKFSISFLYLINSSDTLLFSLDTDIINITISYISQNLTLTLIFNKNITYSTTISINEDLIGIENRYTFVFNSLFMNNNNKCTFYFVSNLISWDTIEGTFTDLTLTNNIISLHIFKLLNDFRIYKKILNIIDINEITLYTTNMDIYRKFFILYTSLDIYGPIEYTLSNYEFKDKQDNYIGYINHTNDLLLWFIFNKDTLIIKNMANGEGITNKLLYGKINNDILLNNGFVHPYCYKFNSSSSYIDVFNIVDIINSPILSFNFWINYTNSTTYNTILSFGYQNIDVFSFGLKNSSFYIKIDDKDEELFDFSIPEGWNHLSIEFKNKNNILNFNRLRNSYFNNTHIKIYQTNTYKNLQIPFHNWSLVTSLKIGSTFVNTNSLYPNLLEDFRIYNKSLETYDYLLLFNKNKTNTYFTIPLQTNSNLHLTFYNDNPIQNSLLKNIGIGSNLDTHIFNYNNTIQQKIINLPNNISFNLSIKDISSITSINILSNIQFLYSDINSQKFIINDIDLDTNFLTNKLYYVHLDLISSSYSCNIIEDNYSLFTTNISLFNLNTLFTNNDITDSSLYQYEWKEKFVNDYISITNILPYYRVNQNDMVSIKFDILLKNYISKNYSIINIPSEKISIIFQVLSSSSQTIIINYIRLSNIITNSFIVSFDLNTCYSLNLNFIELLLTVSAISTPNNTYTNNYTISAEEYESILITQDCSITFTNSPNNIEALIIGGGGGSYNSVSFGEGVYGGGGAGIVISSNIIINNNSKLDIIIGNSGMYYNGTSSFLSYSNINNILVTITAEFGYNANSEDGGGNSLYTGGIGDETSGGGGAGNKESGGDPLIINNLNYTGKGGLGSEYNYISGNNITYGIGGVGGKGLSVIPYELLLTEPKTTQTVLDIYYTKNNLNYIILIYIMNTGIKYLKVYNTITKLESLTFQLTSLDEWTNNRYENFILNYEESYLYIFMYKKMFKYSIEYDSENYITNFSESADSPIALNEDMYDADPASPPYKGLHIKIDKNNTNCILFLEKNFYYGISNTKQRLTIRSFNLNNYEYSRYLDFIYHDNYYYQSDYFKNTEVVDFFIDYTNSNIYIIGYKNGRTITKFSYTIGNYGEYAAYGLDITVITSTFTLTLPSNVTNQNNGIISNAIMTSDSKHIIMFSTYPLDIYSFNILENTYSRLTSLPNSFDFSKEIKSSDYHTYYCMINNKYIIHIFDGQLNTNNSLIYLFDLSKIDLYQLDKYTIPTDPLLIPYGSGGNCDLSGDNRSPGIQGAVILKYKIPRREYIITSNITQNIITNNLLDEKTDNNIISSDIQIENINISLTKISYNLTIINNVTKTYDIVKKVYTNYLFNIIHIHNSDNLDIITIIYRNENIQLEKEFTITTIIDKSLFFEFKIINNEIITTLLPNLSPKLILWYQFDNLDFINYANISQDTYIYNNSYILFEKLDFKPYSLTFSESNISSKIETIIDLNSSFMISFWFNKIDNNILNLINLNEIIISLTSSTIEFTISSISIVSPSILNNEWNNYILTYNNSGPAASSFSLYINGILKNTQNFVGFINNGKFTINNIFPNKLADFRIYNIIDENIIKRISQKNIITNNNQSFLQLTSQPFESLIYNSINSNINISYDFTTTLYDIDMDYPILHYTSNNRTILSITHNYDKVVTQCLRNNDNIIEQNFLIDSTITNFNFTITDNEILSTLPTLSNNSILSNLFNYSNMNNTFIPPFKDQILLSDNFYLKKFNSFTTSNIFQLSENLNCEILLVGGGDTNNGEIIHNKNFIFEKNIIYEIVIDVANCNSIIYDRTNTLTIETAHNSSTTLSYNLNDSDELYGGPDGLSGILLIKYLYQPIEIEFKSETNSYIFNKIYNTTKIIKNPFLNYIFYTDPIINSNIFNFGDSDSNLDGIIYKFDDFYNSSIDMILWFPFNQTNFLIDSIGNHNITSIVLDPYIKTFKTGDSCLQLLELGIDKDDIYANTLLITDVDLSLEDSFTICFWINKEFFSTDIDIKTFYFNNTSENFSINFSESNIKIQNTISDSESIEYYFITGDWYHIAVSLSKIDLIVTWKLYINGVIKINNNKIIYPSESYSNFTINFAEKRSSFLIDDLRIYNRELNLEEINIFISKSNSISRIIEYQYPICQYDFTLLPVIINNGNNVPTYTGQTNNFYYYAFLESGTIEFTLETICEILIVGGGGAGGGTLSGGGGAGSVIHIPTATINTGSYVINIGRGGLGPINSSGENTNSGENGLNSSFNNIIAEGGGGGGYFNNSINGKQGGSGGGGGADYDSTQPNPIGGDIGTSSSLNGFTGFIYQNIGGSGLIRNTDLAGGGGGGAETPGIDGNISNNGIGGKGGNGILINIDGNNYYWGGGGGGCSYTKTAGDGGLGGGGGGSVNNTNIGGGGSGGINLGTSGNSNTGGNGGANTGSGGGGGGWVQASGGNGGSGIVIIRFNTPDQTIIYDLSQNLFHLTFIIFPTIIIFSTTTKYLITARKYPPIAMSSTGGNGVAFSQTLTSSYGSGSYTISASSYYDTNGVFPLGLAFNGIFPAENGFGTIDNSYDLRTGDITGAFFIVSGYTGEWIKLQIPNQIYLSYIKIYQRNDFASRSPKVYKVYGSLNNTTWNEILNETNAIYTNACHTSQLTNLSQIGSYTYFAICVNKLIGGDIRAHSLNIDEIEFYGNETLITTTESTTGTESPASINSSNTPPSRVGETEYYYYAFQESGTINFTKETNCEILIVAGGGSGGFAGGGGAGGLIYTTELIESGEYNIIVGSGGTAVGYANNGIKGGNSSFNNNIAIGGGYGSQASVGGPGGSGGGGSWTNIGGIGTVGQGNNGGSSTNGGTINYPGSGGGGAGGVGISTTTNQTGGDGGPGLSYNITGTNTIYAAGGGGGARNDATKCGLGGSDGVGGNANFGGNGGNGRVNTGSGGGATFCPLPTPPDDGCLTGVGGSGIVIIRFSTTDATFPASINSSNTLPSRVGETEYYYYSFLESGTIEFTQKTNCEIFVIGGGGGGGNNHSGGGGAGAYYRGFINLNSGTTHNITVGEGGIGATSGATPNEVAFNGEDTSISITTDGILDNLILVRGGGGAGTKETTGNKGQDGGCGGGGNGWTGSSGNYAINGGAADNSGIYSIGSGNRGGHGYNYYHNQILSGGGGGGIGGNGEDVSGDKVNGNKGEGGIGGNALSIDIRGYEEAYGGGGGGGEWIGNAAAGGSAGGSVIFLDGTVVTVGGKAADYGITAGGEGVQNTGSGAGSSKDKPGPKGGSGIVIIRFKRIIKGLTEVATFPASINSLDTLPSRIDETEYYYYSFLESGTINFTQDTICDILIVGGGGSGKDGNGGGSGAIFYATNIQIPLNTYNISVGLGGDSITIDGGFSSVFGITSTGGKGSTSIKGGDSGITTDVNENVTVGTTISKQMTSVNIGGDYYTENTKYPKSTLSLQSSDITYNKMNIIFQQINGITIKLKASGYPQGNSSDSAAQVVTMFDNTLYDNTGWEVYDSSAANGSTVNFKTDYNGYYIMLDLGENILFNNFELFGRTIGPSQSGNENVADRLPRVFKIFATNTINAFTDTDTVSNGVNNPNWIEIYNRTEEDIPTTFSGDNSNALVGNPNPTESYRYYMWVLQKNFGQNWGFGIAEMKMYQTIKIGGSGGSSSANANNSTLSQPNGIDGSSIDITGSLKYFSASGSGASTLSTISGGKGGRGGGGNGEGIITNGIFDDNVLSYSTTNILGKGANFTGSGGGGLLSTNGGDQSSGEGGSGIVIIRFQGIIKYITNEFTEVGAFPASINSSNTPPFRVGETDYYYYSFLESGTINFTSETSCDILLVGGGGGGGCYGGGGGGGDVIIKNQNTTNFIGIYEISVGVGGMGGLETDGIKFAGSLGERTKITQNNVDIIVAAGGGGGGGWHTNLIVSPNIGNSYGGGGGQSYTDYGDDIVENAYSGRGGKAGGTSGFTLGGGGGSTGDGGDGVDLVAGIGGTGTSTKIRGSQEYFGGGGGAGNWESGSVAGLGTHGGGKGGTENVRDSVAGTPNTGGGGGGGGGGGYLNGAYGGSGIVIIRFQSIIKFEYIIKELTDVAAFPASINLNNTLPSRVGETDYYYYTFLESDTIEFTLDTICDILIVGGGGSGGYYEPMWEHGGGGAGGVIYLKNITLNGTYGITVGHGGNFSNGGNSIFSTYTAFGGGEGGRSKVGSEKVNGQNGGCGGGGTSWGGVGGNGVENQGFEGGSKGETSGGCGGGGIGTSGFSNGNGGNGLEYDITGENIYYGGGGAGSVNNGAGLGGLGGGANAPTAQFNNGNDGENGKGGGGSSALRASVGGKGGSGIVIIRLQSINIISIVTGLISPYLITNALYFNGNTTDTSDNCYLENLESDKIQNMLQEFHTNKGFSIHFVLKGLSTDKKQPILYLGNNTKYISFYIENTSMKMNINGVDVILNLLGVTMNNFNIYDIVCKIFNNKYFITVYINGIFIECTTGMDYSSFYNIESSDNKYYIGKDPSIENDLSKAFLQDFRIFSNPINQKTIYLLKIGNSNLDTLESNVITTTTILNTNSADIEISNKVIEPIIISKKFTINYSMKYDISQFTKEDTLKTIFKLDNFINLSFTTKTSLKITDNSNNIYNTEWNTSTYNDNNYIYTLEYSNNILKVLLYVDNKLITTIEGGSFDIINFEFSNIHNILENAQFGYNLPSVSFENLQIYDDVFNKDLRTQIYETTKPYLINPYAYLQQSVNMNNDFMICYWYKESNYKNKNIVNITTANGSNINISHIDKKINFYIQNTNYINDIFIDPYIHYKFTEDIGIESNLIDYGSLSIFNLKMKMDFAPPTCPGLTPILVSGTTFSYLQFFNGTCNITFSQDTICDILIVGGGGGGGSNIGLGGGSSGGLIYSTNVTISTAIYLISVGNGGLAGQSGGNTSAFEAIATGGVSSLTGHGAGPGLDNTVGSLISNPNINSFALTGGFLTIDSFYNNTTDLYIWYTFSDNLKNFGKISNYPLTLSGTVFIQNTDPSPIAGNTYYATMPGNNTGSLKGPTLFQYIVSYTMCYVISCWLRRTNITDDDNTGNIFSSYGNAICIYQRKEYWFIKSFNNEFNTLLLMDLEGRKITTGPPIDIWSHYTFILERGGENDDSIHKLTIYMNGSNVYGPISSQSVNTLDSIWYIDLNNSSTLMSKDIEIGSYFIGDIDDFRIYSRKLTDIEILELYKGPSISEGSLGGGGGGIGGIGNNSVGGEGSNISITNEIFGRGGTGATQGVEDIETVVGIGSGGNGSGTTNGQTGGRGTVIIKWNIENNTSIPISLIKTINNTLPSYNNILQNAYYFSTIDNYVSYEGDSIKINNLLTSFHNNNGFSIHFVLSNVLESLTTQENISQPIFYCGSNNNFIDINIINNVMNFNVNNSFISTFIPDITNYHIYDFVYNIIENTNCKLAIYIDNIETTFTTASYSQTLSNINTPGYVYNIGKKKVIPNNLSKIYLQDFRIYNKVLTNNEINMLQIGDNPVRKLPLTVYRPPLNYLNHYAYVFKNNISSSIYINGTEISESFIDVMKINDFSGNSIVNIGNQKISLSDISIQDIKIYSIVDLNIIKNLSSIPDNTGVRIGADDRGKYSKDITNGSLGNFKIYTHIPLTLSGTTDIINSTSNIIQIQELIDNSFIDTITLKTLIIPVVNSQIFYSFFSEIIDEGKIQNLGKLNNIDGIIKNPDDKISLSNIDIITENEILRKQKNSYNWIDNTDSNNYISLDGSIIDSKILDKINNDIMISYNVLINNTPSTIINKDNLQIININESNLYIYVKRENIESNILFTLNPSIDIKLKQYYSIKITSNCDIQLLYPFSTISEEIFTNSDSIKPNDLRIGQYSDIKLYNLSINVINPGISDIENIVITYKSSKNILIRENDTLNFKNPGINNPYSYQWYIYDNDISDTYIKVEKPLLIYKNLFTTFNFTILFWKKQKSMDNIDFKLKTNSIDIIKISTDNNGYTSIITNITDNKHELNLNIPIELEKWNLCVYTIGLFDKHVSLSIGIYDDKFNGQKSSYTGSSKIEELEKEEFYNVDINTETSIEIGNTDIEIADIQIYNRIITQPDIYRIVKNKPDNEIIIINNENNIIKYTSEYTSNIWDDKKYNYNYSGNKNSSNINLLDKSIFDNMVTLSYNSLLIHNFYKIEISIMYWKKTNSENMLYSDFSIYNENIFDYHINDLIRFNGNKIDIYNSSSTISFSSTQSILKDNWYLSGFTLLYDGKYTIIKIFSGDKINITNAENLTVYSWPEEVSSNIFTPFKNMEKPSHIVYGTHPYDSFIIVNQNMEDFKIYNKNLSSIFLKNYYTNSLINGNIDNDLLLWYRLQDFKEGNYQNVISDSRNIITNATNSLSEEESSLKVDINIINPNRYSILQNNSLAYKITNNLEYINIEKKILDTNDIITILLKINIDQISDIEYNIFTYGNINISILNNNIIINKLKLIDIQFISNIWTSIGIIIHKKVKNIKIYKDELFINYYIFKEPIINNSNGFSIMNNSMNIYNNYSISIEDIRIYKKELDPLDINKYSIGNL